MWKIINSLRGFRNKLVNAFSANIQSTTTVDERHCCAKNQSCQLSTITPSYKYKFTESDSSNDNAHSDKGKHRDKKYRKKTCNFYNSLPPRAGFCSVLEAVGWGTAVLFGLQYVGARSREIYRSPHREDENKSTVPNILPRFLKTASKDSPFIRSVLPDGGLKYDGRFTLSELSRNSEIGVQSNREQISEKNEVKLNFETAVEKLQSVADLCTSKIENDVGIYLAKCNKDSEALSFFIAGCNLGNAKSCYNAGVCFESGIGTQKDIQKAKEMYELAAQHGHPFALYNLAVYYLNGLGNLEKDVDKGMGLLEEAARNGVKEAQEYLGVHYVQNEEFDRAIPYLRSALQHEDSNVQYCLGICYENGWGVDENLAKAASLYSKAAHQGHKDAAFNLAEFYELGLGGLPKNTSTATEWYETAAMAGHVEAETRLSALTDLSEKLTGFGNNYDEYLENTSVFQLNSSTSAPNIHSTVVHKFIATPTLTKSSSTTRIELNNDSEDLFHCPGPSEKHVAYPGATLHSYSSVKNISCH